VKKRIVLFRYDSPKRFFDVDNSIFKLIASRTATKVYEYCEVSWSIGMWFPSCKVQLQTHLEASRKR